jgi:hypothetical protein
MTSRLNLVRITPVGTTTATTTPWPLPASPGALRFHALPIFSLDASYRNPRRSTVQNGTCLKIMVTPVRVRVPPLLFLTGYHWLWVLGDTLDKAELRDLLVVSHVAVRYTVVSSLYSIHPYKRRRLVHMGPRGPRLSVFTSPPLCSP